MPTVASVDSDQLLRDTSSEVSFLLSGDVSIVAASTFTTKSASLGSDVLKAVHHGSRTFSSPTFLDAIISVSQDNRFGHPHPGAIDALLQQVSPDILFTTRDRGTIEFVTHGLTLKTDR